MECLLVRVHFISDSLDVLTIKLVLKNMKLAPNHTTTTKQTTGNNSIDNSIQCFQLEDNN